MAKSMGTFYILIGSTILLIISIPVAKIIGSNIVFYMSLGIGIFGTIMNFFGLLGAYTGRGTKWISSTTRQVMYRTTARTWAYITGIFAISIPILGLIISINQFFLPDLIVGAILILSGIIAIIGGKKYKD